MTSRAQQPPLFVARIIFFALIMGVVVFTLVAWVTTQGGAAPARADGAPGAVVWAWAALVLGSLPASLFFLRRARSAAGLDPDFGGAPEPARPEAILSNLMIAWALVEAPVLMGVGVFFLFGSTYVLLYALAAAALGWGLGAPKAEYFEGAEPTR